MTKLGHIRVNIAHLKQGVYMEGHQAVYATDEVNLFWDFLGNLFAELEGSMEGRSSSCASRKRRLVPMAWRQSK